MSTAIKDQETPGQQHGFVHPHRDANAVAAADRIPSDQMDEAALWCDAYAARVRERIAEDLVVILKKHYPGRTAAIRLLNGDGVFENWFVGAMPGIDNETTLRQQVSRHRPGCQYVASAII